MDKSPFFSSLSSPFSSFSNGNDLDTSSVKKCRFCDYSLQGLSFAAVIKHEATHVVFCPPQAPSCICKKPAAKPEPDPQKNEIIDEIELEDDCTNVGDLIPSDEFFRGNEGCKSVHGGSRSQKDRNKKEISCDQDDQIAQLISARVLTYNVDLEWKTTSIQDFYQCLKCGTRQRKKGLTKEKLYLHSIEHRLTNKIKIIKNPTAHLSNLKSISRPTCKAKSKKSSSSILVNENTTEINEDKNFRNLEEEDAKLISRVSEYDIDLDWKKIMVGGKCKFLECIKCGLRFKRYDSRYRIFSHANSHFQNREKTLFKCRYKSCSKEFYKIGTRDTHILTHLTMDERPFPCNFCDFRFYRVDSLKLHAQRMHTKNNKSSKKRTLKSKTKYNPDLKTKVELGVFQNQKVVLEYPVQNQNQNSIEMSTYHNKVKVKVESGLKNFQDILKLNGRRSTNNSMSDVDLDLLNSLSKIKDHISIKCEVPDPDYCPTDISNDQDEPSSINNDTETHVTEKTENPTFNQAQEDEMIAEMVSNYDIDSEWVKIMDNKKIECLICHSKLNRNSTSKKSLFLHSAMHKGLFLFQCRYCDSVLSRPQARKVHENSLHLKTPAYHCTQCPQKFCSYSIYWKHKKIHKKRQISILNKNRYKNKKNSITSLGSQSHTTNSDKAQIKLTKKLIINIPKLIFSKSEDNKIKILDLNGNEKTYLSSTSFNTSSEREPNFLEEIIPEIDENLLYELNKPVDDNDENDNDDLKPDMNIVDLGRSIIREEEIRKFAEMQKEYDWTGDFKLIQIKGKKMFKCSNCEELIAQKRSLLSHFMIHSQKFPFSCFYCSKGFRSHTAKVRHENIHTNLREYCGNFPCTYCSKVFDNNYRRKEHESRHTGEKRYVCNFCKAKFSTMSGLYHHKKGVHNYQSRSKRINSKVKLSKNSQSSNNVSI